jgi:glutaredoxin 3
MGEFSRLAGPDKPQVVTFRETSVNSARMIVYVKPWCPWCVQAENWLKSRNYRFESVDVLTDAAAYKRMREISGQSLTPTLEMPDGKVLADFDVGQLEKFLREHNIVPG